MVEVKRDKNNWQMWGYFNHWSGERRNECGTFGIMIDVSGGANNGGEKVYGLSL